MLSALYLFISRSALSSLYPHQRLFLPSESARRAALTLLALRPAAFHPSMSSTVLTCLNQLQKIHTCNNLKVQAKTTGPSCSATGFPPSWGAHSSRKRLDIVPSLPMHISYCIQTHARTALAP
ncbi:hypothetical protein BC827DRAFT_749934 [Russula dissimulans]|nr:hypothetical protein BC827DRAFT_749934 [Russula dissimulans]